MRRLSMIGLLLLACGDDGSDGGGVGARCNAHADCDQDLACAGPNDHPGCGIPPREQCTDDSTCGGDRCHVIPDPCSVDGFGTECRSACTGDGNCGAGFRCDNGACRAILCDAGAGVTCAGREVCDPARITAATPLWDHTDGCFPVACTSDDACGERACVNGECQDTRGTCVEPIAIP